MKKTFWITVLFGNSSAIVLGVPDNPEPPCVQNGTTVFPSKLYCSKNVLIIGAGEATKILLSTIKSSMKDAYNVIGLIDDNTNKVNYAISGNKILGTRYDIPRICMENKVELIFFTISNISNEDRRKILEICQETGCKVRILPGTKELIKDKPIMQSFRNVEIEDLLRKRAN